MKPSRRSSGLPGFASRKQIVWGGILRESSAVTGEYLKRRAAEMDPHRRAGPVTTYIMPMEEVERRYGKPGEFKETKERVWNYQK